MHIVTWKNAEREVADRLHLSRQTTWTYRIEPARVSLVSRLHTDSEETGRTVALAGLDEFAEAGLVGVETYPALSLRFCVVCVASRHRRRVECSGAGE
jgi:hypothetical protein